MAGGLGFQATLCLTGLATILAWAFDRTGAEYLRMPWLFFLLAFVGWAGISTFWSEHEGKNVYLLMGLLVPLLFIPLVVMRLSERAKQALIWAVIAIGVLGVLLLFIDSATTYAVSIFVDPVKPDGDRILRLVDAEKSIGRGQVSYAQLIF